MKTACLFAAVVITLSAPVADGAESLAGKRPNIILLLIDDQGYGDASCNGNPILKTPNIDRLCHEGVHFEDFHVSPTCSPTRSSLMSGKHEFKNGVTHTIRERERMSLKTTTIAQVLQGAGYRTAIFGKWHLGDEDAYQPEKRGFDEVFIHGGGGIGQRYPGSCADAPGNRYFDPAIKHNGRFVKTSGYCSDVFFAAATKWLETVKGDMPFFLYLATNAPHVPLDCPPEYERIYAGKVPPDVAKFYGMIANIDDNLGKLLGRLKEWGIDEQTLVICINDNGGFPPACKIWNAGMAGSKCTASNGGTRAMSLWRWPGKIKPAACEKLAAHVDIFPTFAELAAAKVPGAVRAAQDGFSLVPLLENPNAAWHDERMLFTHVGRWPLGSEPAKYGQYSVRWQQYLMVGGKGLFDLKSDPGEKTNLAGKEVDVVARLNRAYDRWWDEVRPCMENERAYLTAPSTPPFVAEYFKQFQGAGPNHVPPEAIGKPRERP
jgi:arylsulfatase A-like enzyme